MLILLQHFVTIWTYINLTFYMCLFILRSLRSFRYEIVQFSYNPVKGMATFRVPQKRRTNKSDVINLLQLN